MTATLPTFSTAAVRQENYDVQILLDRIAHLERLAYQDDLTGLPNRRSFDERAFDFLIEGSLLFIMDLNDFKKVNDTQGHQAGDEYLRMVGQRLFYLPGAFCCRLGGDEFCGILPPGSLCHLDELLSAIGPEHASIGVCQVRAGTTLSEAKKKADEAMYRAKRRHARLVEVTA